MTHQELIENAWLQFIERLHELQPLPDGASHQSFLGSIKAYKKIFVEANKLQATDEDSWEANAEYLLERCPYTVRHRPGGGPEDLKASLVATFLGMTWRLKEIEKLMRHPQDQK